MKKIPLLLLSLSIFYTMQSQTTQSIAGEYYLSDVRETASGFKLNEDSSFEFFFSQGALDRTGKGTFTVSGNTILFNSPPPPGQDYSFVTSGKQQPYNKTIVSVRDPNKNILSYVFSRVKAGKEMKDAFADSHGDAVYDLVKPDTIELMFEFCPEKIAVFPATNKDHNYFEFKFNTWLFEYFFNNFTLRLENGELQGAHPILQGTQFSYTKQ